MQKPPNKTKYELNSAHMQEHLLSKGVSHAKSPPVPLRMDKRDKRGRNSNLPSTPGLQIVGF